MRCAAVASSAEHQLPEKSDVEGLQRIKELGGTCIVQTPESAEVSYMPEQAIRNVAVDHIVAADELGSFINNLLME